MGYGPYNQKNYINLCQLKWQGDEPFKPIVFETGSVLELCIDIDQQHGYLYPHNLIDCNGNIDIIDFPKKSCEIFESKSEAIKYSKLMFLQ